nr:hypothetical protein [Variovorax boronicumulans]
MKTKLPPRLGIDIGHVLIAPSDDSNDDTSFIGGSASDALATPAYPGMFEHVPVIVQRFRGEVWLVSKAGPRVQERTLRWLAHHDFYRKTGIQPGNVRFCRERHQKAEHCVDLELTHFIDDREDVLRHLAGLVPNRFLFGPQRAPVVDQRLTCVANWAEANLRVMPTWR